MGHKRTQGYYQKVKIGGVLEPVGTLVVDGVWGGIRIKRSTGTKKPSRFNAIIDCLNTLELMQNTEALVWASTARNDLLELLNWFQNKDKKSPPWDSGGDILSSSMMAWLNRTTKIGAKTKATYKGSIDVLLKHIGKYPDKVSHLPKILEAFKKEYSSKQIAFNNTYSTCLSFLNDEVGEEHNLYKQVQSIGKYPRSQIKPKRQARPLTPIEIQNRFVSDPTNEMKMVVFFLCSTGMRPYEYLEHGFEVGDNYIEIFGKKTEHSKRIVPKLWGDYNPQPSSLGLTINTLRSEFQRWFPERTIQDTRYSFANWVQKAGIESNRYKYYMGHQPGQTDRYQRQDVIDKWVDDDARKLLDYLQRSLQQFPEIDTKAIKLPKSVDELTSSVSNVPKQAIIEHLNKYLRDNHPAVFRRLYEVEGLRYIPTY